MMFASTDICFGCGHEGMQKRIVRGEEVAILAMKMLYASLIWKTAKRDPTATCLFPFNFHLCHVKLGMAWNLIIQTTRLKIIFFDIIASWPFLFIKIEPELCPDVFPELNSRASVLRLSVSTLNYMHGRNRCVCRQKYCFRSFRGT